MRRFPFFVGLIVSGLISLLGCQHSSDREMNLSVHTEGVAYEIFVQAFADGNGDNIGDFIGLTRKLDYIQDLGVDMLWLMPIHPSPSYHKYDVTDYKAVHPDYGSMEDFETFLEEAHRRNIKVILDMVFNHSSDQHPWFQLALEGPENVYRDYYVWSDEAEVMAKDPEWHWLDVKEAWQGEGAYDREKYYGFFWKAMPDLNLYHPPLRQEIMEIGKFWLDKGVDGFRLDAVKFLNREENVADNVAFLKEFTDSMKTVNEEVYIVGEVWDSASAIAPYLGGIPSAFNFDLATAMVTAAKTGKDSLKIVETWQRIQEQYQAHSQDYYDATFLTNHDMDRIGSEVKGNTNRMKVAASLLLTLPGTPFIYYGEELGMLGKKPDEQIREPFLWTAEAEDPDYAKWEEVQYNSPDQLVPLSQQTKEDSSLYHHYKKLIKLRKDHKALLEGTLLPYSKEVQPQLIAFYRTIEAEKLLVIHNLSG
ncbi:MAG: alpha-amylase family glycosyl hydrolase, partial [Bacteroidota bacterium]